MCILDVFFPLVDDMEAKWHKLSKSRRVQDEMMARPKARGFLHLQAHKLSSFRSNNTDSFSFRNQKKEVIKCHLCQRNLNVSHYAVEDVMSEVTR